MVDEEADCIMEDAVGDGVVEGGGEYYGKVQSKTRGKGFDEVEMCSWHSGIPCGPFGL